MNWRALLRQCPLQNLKKRGSDGALPSRLAMERLVQPELLDELPPQDPRAARSRRDLQRLNAWMRHPAIMARALGATLKGEPMHRIVELGAGDGHFLVRVARRLNGRWQSVEAILVDRLDVFDPQTRCRFALLGWRVKAETAEALDWLRERRAGIADAIISNLLLHQFSREQIAELFRLVSCSARVFIALEPRRALWPLFCSRLLWLMGCGAVTRHDAPASVLAGFRDKELSALWPDAQNWEFTEHAVGWFSHLFVASRKVPAAAAPKRRFGAPRRRKGWRTPKPGGGSTGSKEASTVVCSRIGTMNREPATEQGCGRRPSRSIGDCASVLRLVLRLQPPSGSGPGNAST